MGRKYRVEMTNVAPWEHGTVTHAATDYVPEEILNDYVADARTRWASVIVTPESE